MGAWYSVNVARGLKELGVDVLFVGKDNLPPVQQAANAGLKVDNSMSFTLSSFFLDVVKFSQLLDFFPADVVNAHRSEGMNIAIAANKLRGKKAPKIIRTRVEIRHPKTHPFNRWAYRHIEGVIVPWDEGREKLIKDMKFSGNKILLLPGGVDTEKFRPGLDASNFRTELGIGKDDLVVGMVGRLDPVKGHEDFIICAKHVLASIANVHFLIIGEEANIKVESLKTLAQQVGVAERVHFVGRREDIEVCINAFDVGVIASVGSEALSRVALEYMACGLPTVATRVGGLPAVIEEGVNGFLVPPHAPHELANNILRIFQDSSLSERLGENARKIAVSRYSLPVVARETMKFFERAIS